MGVLEESIRRERERLGQLYGADPLRSALSSSFTAALERHDQLAKQLSADHATRLTAFLRAPQPIIARVEAHQAGMLAMRSRMDESLLARMAVDHSRTLTDHLRELATRPVGMGRLAALLDHDALGGVRATMEHVARLIGDHPPATDAVLALLRDVEPITDAMVAVDGDQLVTSRELNEHLAQVRQGMDSWEELVAFVRRVPRPIASVLIAIIVTVLLWIAEGQVQAISAELLAPVTKAMIAKAQDLLREVVPAEDRHAFRIVTGDGLRVRVSPRTNASRILGTLRVGTIVVFVRETKDWTLIEYHDGEARIRGWVFSRYLQSARSRP